jgi:peptidoglycan/LPS O-acetylase OafA/YrhL
MCVVAAHSRSSILGLPLLQSGMAVKTFFMISGFYMTLILTSKYHADKGGGYWLFISNRFLRIYPSYLVVFTGSVLLLVASSIKLHKPVDRLRLWVDAWHGHHGWGLVLIALSQVSIFGMDAVAQFDFSAAHGFGLAGAWGPAGQEAWRFNLLRQSWSISVELFFYLVAPLICVARRQVQVAIVVAAGVGSLLAYHFLPAPLGWDITYYWFPFQLGYLVLGVLSFHLLHPLFKEGNIHAAWSWGVLVPFAAVILFWGRMPQAFADIACIALAFFAIPLLFNLTRKARFDRFIGDLSYPMYLAHIPCKWVMLAVMGVTTTDSAIVPAWALLLLTTVVAMALVWMVDYPVDRWRQARVAATLAARQGKKTSPEPAPIPALGLAMALAEPVER